METRWVSLFGCPPPRSAALIAQAIAWQEQVLASGDVTAAVRHDLALAAEQVRAERTPEAAPDEGSAAALPTATSQLLPGTRLVKVHGGRTHVVEVTGEGMLYEGVVHASLSAVAKAITGTHWKASCSSACASAASIRPRGLPAMAEARLVRCAVYTRKSSDEGLEQSFNSLHAQREACEAYIVSQKHEGWVLVATAYDDGGFSGGSMERPGLKALMADVTAGLIDTVVVYKVDRLTRSLADFAKMVELFDARSASFVSVTQAFNTTTSMGRLTLNVLLSFAQFEREVTGERIRDKIAASKAKGMWMGGAVPLGYDVVGRQLVVNEAEAEQVRELFARYLELAGVDDLVAHAAARGIRSKVRVGGKGAGDAPLGRGSLYRILANPIYVGEIGHKEQRYPGQHVAIVERSLHDAVQAKLAANRRKGRGQTVTAARAMLSGLLVDPAGLRLTPTHTGRPGKRYRYYAGGELRVPAPELEALVTDALVATLASPAKLAAILPDLSLLTPEMIAAAAGHAATLQRATVGQRRQSATQLIDQVTVNPTALVVRLKLDTLGSAGIAPLVIPATIGRSRARLTLVVPGTQPPRPAAALIAMVAQARSWFERIASGEHRSLGALAAAEAVTPAYIRQIIGAAFLAPDLVTGIVEGRQPPALTAARLRELLPLPASWPDQRALVKALA